jgi:hypothetical protein
VMIKWVFFHHTNAANQVSIQHNFLVFLSANGMAWIRYLWMMKWVFFHYATAATEVSNHIKILSFSLSLPWVVFDPSTFG